MASASRSFFTPPPNATTDSRRTTTTLPRQQQHQRPAGERLVDMDTLVWPPPQQKQRSSPTTTTPHNNERRDRYHSQHPYTHASAPTSPPRASTSSRRAQPSTTLANENRQTSPPVRQPTSSTSHLQQRHTSQPTRPNPNLVHHAKESTTSPLRPSFIHSNTSPPVLGRGNDQRPRRPQIQDEGKDFSTEDEVPARHYQSNDYAQHQTHPHPLHHQPQPPPQPQFYNNPPPPPPPPPADSIPFFEPLVANPIPISHHESHNPGYLSPVMDGRGRAINGRMCRVPPSLGPGGVIQPGWPEEYIRQAWPTVNAVGTGGSRTPLMMRQSPLRYGGPTPNDEEEDSESESSDSETDPYDLSGNEDDDPSPHPHPHLPPRASRSPPHPTRLGYWNRRGDTIGETGHIRPAPPTQTFPPDLAHYPEYALMNEIGQVTLPATCVERVLSWRECRD